MQIQYILWAIALIPAWFGIIVLCNVRNPAWWLMAFAATISTICLTCNMADFMNDGMTYGYGTRKGAIICGGFQIGYLGTFLSAVCFAWGFALHTMQWRALKNHHQDLTKFHLLLEKELQSLRQTATQPATTNI